MNKIKLVAIVGLLFSNIAFADNWSASIGIANTQVKGDEPESGTGFTTSIAYKKYINDKVFVEPSLTYVSGSTPSDDTFTIGNLAVGYKYTLPNNMTLSPRVGPSYFRDKFKGGSSSNYGFNAGVELGINDKVSFDLAYNALKQENVNEYADVTMFTFKYKF